jgi:hypothetical protein
MVKTQLTLIAQADAFFKELVSEALEHQKVSVLPETEFYLVQILSQFLSADRLYTRDSEGNLKEEPLALMVKEAIEAPLPDAQRNLFRHVGDVSLYVAGYFQDSLSRKMVDVDYYIEMGESAYQNVAARAQEDILKALYQELAQKFSSCVDVLAEVSDKTTQKTEKDLLRIYELWVRTKSDRAAKALQEAGIIPNETLKKNIQ